MNELRLRVLGAPVSVIFDAGVTADLALELRNAWSRCLENQPERQERLSHALFPDNAARLHHRYAARITSALGTTGMAAATFEQFASQLTSMITVAGIEARAGELMMLHASGLAHPATGKTVALVGASGVGKTTATRILGVEFGYVSDETVAVDRRGVIEPYAKPLSVIVDDQTAPKKQLGPDELGLGLTPSAASLSAVALLHRDPKAGEPSVASLSHADAIVALVPQTSSLGMIQRPLQWLCSLLDACGGAVRITYREAPELLPMLPGLLERPATSAQWFPAVEEATNVEGSNDLPSGMLHRAQVVDAVEIPTGSEGSELMVMVGQHVLRLAGIAPALWRAASTPARLEEIVRRIATEMPLPDGYEKPLSESIRELKAQGVLVGT